MAAGEGERWGSYVLEEKIGAGGMAEVFRARRIGAASFSKQVCIKRLHAHLSSDQAFVEMFLNEARTGSLLRHRNIVAIDDLGEHAGQYFLAMEYVNGVDLAQLEDRARRVGVAIPADVGAFVAAEVLGALHAAYNTPDPKDGRPLRVVHRDLAPHNILVSFSAEVKLTDFGIAKAEGKGPVTNGMVLRGRIGYMPIEQAERLPLDARADLFALGVVLYELFAGRRPFRGDAPDATIQAIVTAQLLDDRPALATLRPDLPAALVALVEKLMARSADDRFPSAAAALTALSEVREVLTGSFSLAALMAQLFPGLASAMYVPASPGVTPPAALPDAAPTPTPRASLIAGTPPDAAVTASGAPPSRAGTPPGASVPLDPVDPYARTRARLELVDQTDPRASESRAPRAAGARRGMWLAGGAAVVLVAGAAFARTYLRGGAGDVAVANASRHGPAAAGLAPPEDPPHTRPEPAPPALPVAPTRVDPPQLPPPPAPTPQPVVQRDEPQQPGPRERRRRARDEGAAPAVVQPAPAPPAPAPAAPAQAPAPAPTEPRYGTLRIVVLPWANVSIDGIARGRITTAEYRLTEGRHTVQLRDGVDATRPVTIHADGPPTVLRVEREDDPAGVTP